MLINYSRNRGCAPPQKNRNTSLALTMCTVIFTPWFLLDLREHVQETMVVASCWDLLISIADFPCRKSRKKTKLQIRPTSVSQALSRIPSICPASFWTNSGWDQSAPLRERNSQFGSIHRLGEIIQSCVYCIYIYIQNNMVTSFGSLYLVIVKLSKHVFRKTWINLDDFTAILSLLLFSGLL